MPLTTQDIKKVAALARLYLTAEEEVRYAETISSVLGYMELLNEVDTTRVALTAQGVDLVTIVRPDEARQFSDRDQLVAAFPDRVDDFLVVPGVFDASADA